MSHILCHNFKCICRKTAIEILKKKYDPFSIKSMLSSVLVSFLTEFWVHALYCDRSPCTGLVYHLEGPVFERQWNFLLAFLELEAPLCSPSSILLHRFFSSPRSPCMGTKQCLCEQAFCFSFSWIKSFPCYWTKLQCKNCLTDYIRDINPFCSCQNTSASGSLGQVWPHLQLFLVSLWRWASLLNV